MCHALERLVLLDRLDSLYSQVLAGDPARLPFERLLDILRVRINVPSADLASVPAAGPTLVVANHPFGFLEGCVLAALLPRIRPDVKIMANSLLERFKGLAEHFLFVNPFGGADAARENRRGLRAAVSHLRAGGMLVVFPAGEVSHLDLRKRTVVDPPWNADVARLARLTGAAVVPAFFDGANSTLFQFAGLVHPRLRTALLPREFLKCQGREINLRIGQALPASWLNRLETDEARIEVLRHRVYALRTAKAPVIDPGEVADLQSDVEALQPLATMGELTVYCAASHQIPSVLREIGRLREITFRAVGEGTGKPIDLDAFDAHYLHLFVWDSAANAVAGAYRLGPADAIASRHGLRGLYTSTLFRFNRAFLDRLGAGAVELGRSFVRPEYQKSYTPLLLLWKGIAAWIASNTGYSVLFGPVSISGEYSRAARELMVTYFSEHESDPRLAELIRARRPVQSRGQAGCWTLEELSAAVADLEPDGKGIPVLLRQYLKLGGKLVGFNLDPSFGNCLDGLIVVDLRQTDRRVLERYMGKAETVRFLAETERLDRMEPTCQPTSSRGGISFLDRFLQVRSRLQATVR